MRKYFFSLIAVVLAVGLSAFTMKKGAIPRQAVRYAIHTGSTIGTEKNFAFYSFQANAPVSLPCVGANIVCWFRVFDLNANGITEQSEFTNGANALDTDSDGIISDNQFETAGVYQEKLGSGR